MKRLAVFCDGTWNRPDAPEPTNVFKLYQATQDSAAQQRLYVRGVGTGYGLTGLRRVADIVLGGLFGVGVNRNIKAAYRFLAEHYEPGDQIYIFGFSRGAFTARSLAGMIRASGFPPRLDGRQVDRAFRRYRNRSDETKPDSDASLRFRLGFSPDFATSPAEQSWRRAAGQDPGHLVTIAYLGIWDTIGQLGVPGSYHTLGWLLNGRHQFHDTELSGSVRAARHAVSIDETRKAYPPTLWTNLTDLNLASRVQSGKYAQRWFPGDHGSVGGGGDIAGLSNITLRWIAEGAEAEGLEIGDDRRAEDPMAPLINKSGRPDLITRLMRLRRIDRIAAFGPVQSWEVAEPAYARHAKDPSYRPELFSAPVPTRALARASADPVE